MLSIYLEIREIILIKNCFLLVITSLQYIIVFVLNES